ncbi:heavy metal translocating P-type ATPase [Falsigemmobacter faecalis]|uniref:Heavy metal translocating P-type ATPase n=1 Tax=Falsigemmobacter faecalis TaxID=2488730 RepID=A0A3P3DLT9_9RHOB|nr:copper-translocating P-type ATPase [Falsigemmobacter faecalis]RRH75141.1 heavy metal translocating P-type ATPase [Falsigemmobacter faecalis]
MATTTIGLEGLFCAACVGRAERVLGKLPGVTGVSVSLAREEARIESEAPVDLQTAGEALGRAGYGLRQLSTQLSSEGMSCASCVARVEKLALAEPGVISVSAIFSDGLITLRHADEAGLIARLQTRLAAAGYPAVLAESEDPAARQAARERDLARRARLAALLTLPVFVTEMGGHMIPAFHHWLHAVIDIQALWWMQAGLTAAVLLGPGRMFLTRGVPALLRLAPDMNSLVALGTLSAFVYSLVVLIAPGLLPEAAQVVYFEAAAVIVTLILLGRWLEARARGQTGGAIRELMALQPDVALIEGPEGPVERPSAALSAGEILLVRPGERLAADGVILSGRSHIDESMLTGEPLPVAREAGAEVTGGTINGSGALRVEITRAGASSRLAQIVAMVGEAQAGKLPIQGLVDRVTGVFVPVVMAIAALSVLAWLMLTGEVAEALVAGVSVLIVACPCAMGLATPVSIMVGTGRAARLGVLFRKGEALQRLASVQALAFDKTGTLTEGRPELVELVPLAGEDPDRLLALAAAAEALSEHHIAKAVRRAAEARGLLAEPAAEMETLPGRGLRAMVGGQMVRLGHEAFLSDEGVSGGTELLAQRPDARAAGQSLLLMALGSRAVALLIVADPVRAGSAAAVAALHGQGLRVRMISGDAQATAEAVGRSLGISEVMGGALPQDKLAAIQASPATAFVGDGINDAPVLAAADVGIAMGGGTDVAIEAADVVLVGSDPRAVVTALEISRATMRNIKENLFWAFAYNTALIPVAAGVLWPLWGIRLSPVLAAAAMALSSVFVISNALRLRRAGRAAVEIRG